MNSFYLKFLLSVCLISTAWNIQANEKVSRFFSLFPLKALEGNTLNFTAIHMCPPIKISISMLDYQYPRLLACILRSISMLECQYPGFLACTLWSSRTDAKLSSFVCAGTCWWSPITLLWEHFPYPKNSLMFSQQSQKNKKMLYTSSCQLLPFASRINLVGKIHNGLKKQRVVFLVSVSYPETT